MSKRKKTRTRPVSTARSTSSSRSTKSRGLRLLRPLLVLLLLGGIVGGGLAAFKQNYDIEHDLSVIGQGVPAVVQIHDPQCQLCQKLRRNANSALAKIKLPLLYRVADITTTEGRRLQRRHDVPHVTLLLFDGSGNLRNVLRGVKDAETLEHAFQAHLNRWGSS